MPVTVNEPEPGFFSQPFHQQANVRRFFNLIGYTLAIAKSAFTSTL